MPQSIYELINLNERETCVVLTPFSQEETLSRHDRHAARLDLHWGLRWMLPQADPAAPSQAAPLFPRQIANFSDDAAALKFFLRYISTLSDKGSWTVTPCYITPDGVHHHLHSL